MGGINTNMQEMSKSRVPLKIRVFLWQLLQDQILSREQLLKRNGPGDGKCILCGNIENADHVVLSCPVAVYMWASIREALGSGLVPVSCIDFLGWIKTWGRQNRRWIW